MIRPDLEFLRMTFQIVPILLECAYNREQLFVVDLVITFVNVERLGEEGNWMPQRIAWVQLAQYCAGSEITSIGRQSEGLTSSGIRSMGAVVKASFSASNAVCCAGSQTQG